MSEKSELNQCPKCGGPIPAEAPQGLCPKCLLAQASIPTDAGLGQGRPAPPSQQELAAAFPQLEILELIGQGGMGFVFKARQPKLERLVALKILPQTSDPAFAERFTREGRVLARLNHPNIVTIHDFGQANGFFYLLMEYVDGVNLRQAMRAGRFTPEQALAVVPKICDALQFAHNEGILHRDIKPENILLDAKGRVKIADFGIAKLIGEPNSDAKLTASGGTLGTPHYMAPEQIEKPSAVDHRADIYSLGVVFYEMLTGELPLGKFQPPSRKVEMDVRLDDVVLHALEKEPERRYQQVSEVKTAVDTIATEPPRGGSGSDQAKAGQSLRRPDGSLLTSVATSKGSQKPDRFWRWFAVAVVAMVAVPVVLAILALLAALIIPSVLKARRASEARAQAVQAEIQMIQFKKARAAAEPAAATNSSHEWPNSVEELRARFEQALRNADPVAIGALFNWSGVSMPMKAFQLKPLESLASQPTNGTRVRADFAPLPPDFEVPTVRNGLAYSANVSLLGMINGSLNYVENGTNKSWAIQIPYGRAGNHFYLSGTVERKLDGAEASASGFQLRFVAREFETNSPADWLPDANDPSGQSRLRVLKQVLLDGASVESAGFAKFEPDRSEITVLLTDTGGRLFAHITQTSRGRRLAIVWNGRVLSAPVIRDTITSRQVMITGNFGYNESQLLVDVLNHGNRSALAAKLQEARVQLAEMLTTLTDEHPEVIRQKAKIQALERQLKTLESQ